MADIDEVQTLGETALKTLTQLWRQLPRLDHEAGKKLGDEVANARKAIERLVRIACEAQLTSIPLGGGSDEKRLYEPLPFTSGQHKSSRHHTSPTRSDSSMSRSPSGMQKHRPAFPDFGQANNSNNNGNSGNARKPTSKKGEIELDDELTSSTTNQNLLLDPHAETSLQRQHSSTSSAAEARSPGNSKQQQLRANSNNNNNSNDGFVDEAAVAADYERFRRDLNLPAGINYYDDPAWVEMMKSYSSCAGKLPPSRLSLMVQLALRRELMWRLHARMLQMQTDRDSMSEMETKGRCEVEIECTEAREELLAQMQGVKLCTTIDGADDDGDDVRHYYGDGDADRNNTTTRGRRRRSRAQVFDNIHKSFLLEQEMKEMTEKCEKMDQEKAKLVDEVAALTKEVMQLAKDNTALTKKAASPSQALHPEQLSSILEEIGKLRRQVEAQENELQALGV